MKNKRNMVLKGLSSEDIQYYSNLESKLNKNKNKNNKTKKRNRN